jgi:hypothetical protein
MSRELTSWRNRLQLFNFFPDGRLYICRSCYTASSRFGLTLFVPNVFCYFEKSHVMIISYRYLPYLLLIRYLYLPRCIQSISHSAWISCFLKAIEKFSSQIVTLLKPCRRQGSIVSPIRSRQSTPPPTSSCISPSSNFTLSHLRQNAPLLDRRHQVQYLIRKVQRYTRCEISESLAIGAPEV